MDTMREMRQRRSAFFELRGVLGFVLLAFLKSHPTAVAPHLWLLGIAFLLSNFLILFAPASKFDNPAVGYAIFFVDMTVLTVFFSSISSQPDTLLLYYLTVFMATLGGDLRKSVAIAVVAAALYLGFQLSKAGAILLSPQALMHIPLFFITAVSTGYLAQEVATHRRRIRHLKDIQKALESRIEVTDEELMRSEGQRASAQDLACRFQDLVQGLDAIIWEVDAASMDLIFVSRRVETILGYSPEKWVTTSNFWIERIHPDDHERVLEGFRAALRGGPQHQLEYRMMAADGRILWFRNFLQVVRDETGRAQYLRGVMIDVTERKEAEQASKASEARYRLLFESNPQPMWVFDLETLAFLAVNDAAVNLYGYSREEFLAMTIKDIQPAEDVPMLLEAMGKMPAGSGAAGLWRHRKKDGTIIDAEITSHFLVFSGRPAELVSSTDVTDRQKAQAATAQLAAIVTSSSDGIISKTLEGTIVSWNAGAERLYGYSSQEAVGRPISILVPADCADEVPGILEKIKRGEIVDRYETVHLRKDGTQLRVELTICPIHDHAGRIVGASAVARDITEFMRAVTALRESEERFRLFVEHTPAAIAMFDREMRYVATSRRWLTDYRLGEQNIIGRFHYDVFPGLPPHWRDIHQRCLAGAVEKSEEDTFIGPDGKTEWVRWEMRPWRDQEGAIAGTLLFSEVITERKKLEEQLLQSSKIEAIGQLAGGVAHDFNNLLTIISGYSQLLADNSGIEQPAQAHAKEILRASDRAAALTRQLLAFSRRQVLAPQVLDLNSVVANVDKMLRRLIGEDIDLVTHLEPNLGRVKADPGQVEQVIMNLAVNARDAMAEGGNLTLETANVDMDAAYAAAHPPAATGPYVMLAVSDTGVGMDAETKAHIFEPFFTTKGPGKGTGLGLATVYGIVKQSNGYIWVYSELGRGTTFKIYLPRIAEAATPSQTTELPRETHRAAETVLVAEDEVGVRSLVRQVLNAHGYRVIEAARGDEAIALSKSHQGPIHLLVTDVVMPQMSGRELATRLSALYPDLKVLFMSGYTSEGIVHNGVLERDTAFIQKPFTPSALARKVGEVLDSSNNAHASTAGSSEAVGSRQPVEGSPR